MEKRLRDPVVFDKRPWGWFHQYTLNEKSTVKIITVMPGEQLSRQVHKNRDELWVPLDDGLEVKLDEMGWSQMRFNECESMPIQIPRGRVHCVRNVSENMMARFLEIALGDFDEDDIERLEDNYGRI